MDCSGITVEMWVSAAVALNWIPLARSCSFGTGPGGLWWHSQGPCHRWRSVGSLHSGRVRWVAVSPLEPRHCKLHGPLHHGPAVMPENRVRVRLTSEFTWRKCRMIGHLGRLEYSESWCALTHPWKCSYGGTSWQQSKAKQLTTVQTMNSIILKNCASSGPLEARKLCMEYFGLLQM